MLMARRSDTKERLLAASAQLFRKQGYWGTGLSEITAQGPAPWGSLYHFFPGGKEQLGVEALRHSGAGYQRLIDSVFGRSDDPVEAIEAFFGLMIDALERSGFADGCPIATVALDVATSSEPLRQACSDVLSAWTDQIADYLRPTYAERADALAVLALSTFEGATVLSRAHRDTAPLRQARDLLTAALRAGLAAR